MYPDCYHALGIVHQLWRHIPNQFDDYVPIQKPNGYRSLHTAVIAENKSLEVQIRTFEMHNEAELGVCSHFNYKEGAKILIIHLTIVYILYVPYLSIIKSVLKRHHMAKMKSQMA